MKRIILLVVIALSFSMLGMAEDITLALGQQKVLSGAGVTSVSAGNPSVVAISIPKDQSKVILRAVGVGSTQVSLIMKNGATQTYMVTVIAKDPNKIKSEVASLLAGIEGIKLKVVGDRVIIDGQILTKNDNDRINKVISLYGDQVVKFAEFKQAYLPKEDNILVEFNVVEVSNQKKGDYGINWDKAIHGLSVNYNYQKNLVTGAVMGSTLGIVSNFAKALSLMVGNGDARVYDTHKVITIAGKPATYYAGGEFGVRNITQQTSTVEWKQYGTKFNVTPEIDSLGNMRITIDAEISSLAGVMSNGVPSLKTEKIKTSVRIKEGQTIALGGFIKRIKSEDVSKVPGIGSVPVLGALFRSKQYQNGRTDAVVFITAKRITADSQENKQMIDKPLQEFNKEKKKWYQRNKK
ncbi:MAG: hypothetical protein GXO69_02840 [Acidobacteria bacterium]|nr:hypothetical protein [Acidobacteriota bacterium]